MYVSSPRTFPTSGLVHQTTQSFYQVLLDAGVRIYEYTPGFVNAKMYVSDDTVAIVGTAIWITAAFISILNAAFVFFRSSVVQDVRADIEHLLTQCFEIPKDYIRHVRLWKRIVRAFLRLFSPICRRCRPAVFCAPLSGRGAFHLKYFESPWAFLSLDFSGTMY